MKKDDSLKTWEVVFLVIAIAIIIFGACIPLFVIGDRILAKIEAPTPVVDTNLIPLN